MKKLISFFTILLITLSTIVLADFRQELEPKSSIIYQKILNHPFNQELMKGTLNKEIFYYYLKQDDYYLESYSTSLSALADKCDDKNIKKEFYEYANGISTGSETTMHKIYLKGNVENPPIGIGTKNYINFLKQNITDDKKDVGVMIARILPCFSVYLQVALDLKKGSAPNNFYQSWIDLYADENFSKDVAKVFKWADIYYQKGTPEIKEKMRKAFLEAMNLELEFWDYSYKEK